MAAKVKTPEEIQAMEEEVRAYRAEEAKKAAAEQSSAAQPLIDLVDTDVFKDMEEKVADLDALAATMPSIRVHVDALRHGLFGLRQTVDLLPKVPEDAPPAPAEA